MPSAMPSRATLKPEEVSSAFIPASGSERQWPYFWSVLGGKFAEHPKMQTFTVQVADPEFSRDEETSRAVRMD